MLIHQLAFGYGRAGRVEPEGSITWGDVFVGEDGIVRFLSQEQIAAMKPVGRVPSGGGPRVYDDCGILSSG